MMKSFILACLKRQISKYPVLTTADLQNLKSLNLKIWVALAGTAGEKLAYFFGVARFFADKVLFCDGLQCNGWSPPLSTGIHLRTPNPGFNPGVHPPFIQQMWGVNPGLNRGLASWDVGPGLWTLQYTLYPRSWSFGKMWTLGVHFWSGVFEKMLGREVHFWCGPSWREGGRFFPIG
jgi:hypothetical protein